MSSRTAVLALGALAAVALTTGCEKQSPYVSLTAHGVTVKARAQHYCRSGKCSSGNDAPVLFVHAGDTLGIDVPRSVAHDGWRIGAQGDFSHTHYRSIPITTDFQSGATIPVQIVRDESHGIGEWQFTIKVK